MKVRVEIDKWKWKWEVAFQQGDVSVEVMITKVKVMTLWKLNYVLAFSWYGRLSKFCLWGLKVQSWGLQNFFSEQPSYLQDNETISDGVPRLPLIFFFETSFFSPELLVCAMEVVKDPEDTVALVELQMMEIMRLWYNNQWYGSGVQDNTQRKYYWYCALHIQNHKWCLRRWEERQMVARVWVESGEQGNAEETRLRRTYKMEKCKAWHLRNTLFNISQGWLVNSSRNI